MSQNALKNARIDFQERKKRQESSLETVRKLNELRTRQASRSQFYTKATKDLAESLKEIVQGNSKEDDEMLENLKKMRRLILKKLKILVENGRISQETQDSIIVMIKNGKLPEDYLRKIIEEENGELDFLSNKTSLLKLGQGDYIV